MEQRTYMIFTDGACTGNPGPGGWAAIIATPEGKVWELAGAEDPTTNNRMELLATLEALRSIPNETAKVELYTDSKYVIQGITSWIHGWRARGWITQDGKPVSHKALWIELADFVTAAAWKVDWLYIAGHAGYPGNERCDQLAVGMAKNKHLELYNGDLANYPFDLTVLPPNEEAHKPRPKSDPYYLSWVNGQLYRDKTWGECEARVKGKQGVKFKKVRDDLEESRVLTQWGVINKGVR